MVCVHCSAQPEGYLRTVCVCVSNVEARFASTKQTLQDSLFGICVVSSLNTHVTMWRGGCGGEAVGCWR